MPIWKIAVFDGANDTVSLNGANAPGTLNIGRIAPKKIPTCSQWAGPSARPTTFFVRPPDAEKTRNRPDVDPRNYSQKHFWLSPSPNPNPNPNPNQSKRPRTLNIGRIVPIFFSSFSEWARPSVSYIIFFVRPPDSEKTRCRPP